MVDKEKLRVAFFVSEELSKSLEPFRDVFAGQERMKTVPVPGSQGSEKCRLSADLTRLSASKLIESMSTINLLGWSFNGKITADDLFMTVSGDLRFLDTKMEMLVELNDDNERADAGAIAKITRDCIFSGISDLPLDMLHLLSLLEDFKAGQQEAVRQHPALKFESDQLSQFGCLYMTYLEIEKTNPVKFKRIVDRIPYCDLDESHWKLLAEKNDYLRKVMMYRRNQSPNIGLPSISRRAIIQIHRALNRDPKLKQFMSGPLFKRIFKAINAMSREDKALVATYQTTPEEDRQVFFKVLIDNLQVTWYSDDGAGFVRDARNNVQHMVGGSLEGATAAAPVPSGSVGAQAPPPPQASSPPQPPPPPQAAPPAQTPVYSAAGTSTEASGASAATSAPSSTTPASIAGIGSSLPVSAATQSQVSGTSKKRKLNREFTVETKPLPIDPDSGRPKRSRPWSAPTIAQNPTPAPVPSIPPPAIPLVVLLKFFQILHVFGCYYPRFFCDFFMAMHDEVGLTGCTDTTIARLRSKLSGAVTHTKHAKHQ